MTYGPWRSASPETEVTVQGQDPAVLRKQLTRNKQYVFYMHITNLLSLVGLFVVLAALIKFNLILGIALALALAPVLLNVVATVVAIQIAYHARKQAINALLEVTE